MSSANCKKWLYSGAAIFIVSIPAGIVGAIWGISSSFDALKTNESAGIDAVRGGIEAALYSTVFFTITGLIGLAFLMIGVYKMRKFKSLK